MSAWKMSQSLFDTIINTAQDCVFWKDKERRFVGVNQAFLDYYGFASADVLIGKTDEDMGWHSDPEPFKQDELHVLQGTSTYKVLGKCEIRGQQRDIIASKRPIYEDGEIVGLVGSFADVTDVMRRRTSTREQMMYDADSLRKYAFFDHLLEELRIEEILDPLTGVVTRGFILDFAQSLIAEGKPFTFSILDLDNFKFFNDTYGHRTGDAVLMDITKELALFTRDYAVVGRFGGDELLIVDIENREMEEKCRFFDEMYEKQHLLRKLLKVDDHELYVTGTVGCASFPEDAPDYDALFALTDKMLYQGKHRGRNCYVIYEKDTEGSYEYPVAQKQEISVNMAKLMRLLEREKETLAKLRAVLPVLKEQYQISDLYYVKENKEMFSVVENTLVGKAEDIENLMTDKVFSDSREEMIKDLSPVFYETLGKRGIRSILVARGGKEEEAGFYLVCGESRGRRIWQEEERGILFFLATMLDIKKGEDVSETTL